MQGTSSDHQAVAYAPTSSGVMRGWLGTPTNPETHRLWFVLSAETLSYFESPDATDPLGMLGIDEMHSVKASKKNSKEYHMTINLSDERFERRLAQCAAEVAEASVRAASMATAAAAADDGAAPDDPTTPSLITRTSSHARTTLAATTQIDADSPATQEGSRGLSGAFSASGSPAGSSSPSMWSRWRSWFYNAGPDDADLQEGSRGAAKLILVASTPFEADAWSAAIKEAQAALVASAQVACACGRGRRARARPTPPVLQPRPA